LKETGGVCGRMIDEKSFQTFFAKV